MKKYTNEDYTKKSIRMNQSKRTESIIMKSKQIEIIIE